MYDERHDILDAFVGNMGQSDSGNEDKTLRQSSRKALERVLYDPNLGKIAVDYFRELKQLSGKHTYRELALDKEDNEFKHRINDVRDFLTENSRKLHCSDLLNPRVFDKKQIGASVIAVTALPVVAALGVVDAIAHPQIVVNSFKNIMQDRSNGGYRLTGEEHKGVISAISAWTDTLQPEYVKENYDEIRKGNASNRTITNIIGKKDRHILFEKMTGIPIKDVDKQINHAASAGVMV
ncbi:MAG: hypothetical protein PQ614_08330 [Rickettsiales bacterium]|nr:hypothetical protein [Rickettsiales bacterium]